MRNDEPDSPSLRTRRRIDAEEMRTPAQDFKKVQRQPRRSPERRRSRGRFHSPDDAPVRVGYLSLRPGEMLTVLCFLQISDPYYRYPA